MLVNHVSHTCPTVSYLSPFNHIEFLTPNSNPASQTLLISQDPNASFRKTFLISVPCTPVQRKALPLQVPIFLPPTTAYLLLDVFVYKFVSDRRHKTAWNLGPSLFIRVFPMAITQALLIEWPQKINNTWVALSGWITDTQANIKIWFLNCSVTENCPSSDYWSKEHIFTSFSLMWELIWKRRQQIMIKSETHTRCLALFLQKLVKWEMLSCLSLGWASLSCPFFSSLPPFICF